MNDSNHLVVGPQAAEGDPLRLPTQLSCEAVERLETLDDLIFPAIEGDLQAAEASAAVWRDTVVELGPEAVAESRSQYLQYARRTWQFLNHQTVQQPLRMLAVMKIIGVLTGDDA